MQFNGTGFKSQCQSVRSHKYLCHRTIVKRAKFTRYCIFTKALSSWLTNSPEATKRTIQIGISQVPRHNSYSTSTEYNWRDSSSSFHGYFHWFGASGRISNGRGGGGTPLASRAFDFVAVNVFERFKSVVRSTWNYCHNDIGCRTVLDVLAIRRTEPSFVPRGNASAPCHHESVKNSNSTRRKEPSSAFFPWNYSRGGAADLLGYKLRWCTVFSFMRKI